MEQKLFLALFLLVGSTTNWASANRRIGLLLRRSIDLRNKVTVIGNQLNQLTTKLNTMDQRLVNMPATMGIIVQGGVNSILQAINQQCVVPPRLSDRVIYEPDDYLMVFRLTAGIRKSAYDKYVSVGNNDDANEYVFKHVPCGCKTNNGSEYCDRHYRSELLDMWSDLPIEKVKVSLHSEGVTKVNYVFNGEGSSYINFFEQSRLLQDIYTDLSATYPNNPSPNYFSIYGHDVNATEKRRFFINNNYGGCHNDAGWLVVGDGPDKACPWEKYVDGYPFVMYACEFSPNPTPTEPWVRAAWESQLYGVADVLTVSIKLKGATTEC